MVVRDTWDEAHDYDEASNKLIWSHIVADVGHISSPGLNCSQTLYVITEFTILPQCLHRHSPMWERGP